MQTATVHQSKTVGQRIKETLQTSKVRACHSPIAIEQGLLTTAPANRFGTTQINTIRIIGQYLKNLGLQDTVSTLFNESGCRLENALAVKLREYVMSGEWDHALHIVDKMTSYSSRRNLLYIREKLFEEKFVDYLMKDRILDALSLLTVDFPSDPVFAERRNFLATLLYADKKKVDLYEVIGAHQTKGERNDLVADIQKLLPTSMILPCNRLDNLLQQSRDEQCRQCYLHVMDDEEISPDYILENHQCDWDDFPLFISQVLTKHTDEVWCAVFSRDGRFLATGGRSGNVYVWKVVNVGTIEHHGTFDGPSASAICWSDDGRLLAVGSGDGLHSDVTVYDISAGSVYCVIENRDTRASESTVIAFTSDAQPYKIVCADTLGRFCQFEIAKDSVKLDGKFEGYRIRAVHCLSDGSVLAADTHYRVRCYQFADDIESTWIEELSQIMCFTVDCAERYILIDTTLHGLRLWDLKTKMLTRTFTGALHKDFIIHSSFGGPDASYIVTGSEDEHIYIWNRKSEDLLAKISGHTARVNCVAWNPHMPQLVSCSDDCTVRVWCPLDAPEAFDTRMN